MTDEAQSNAPNQTGDQAASGDVTNQTTAGETAATQPEVTPETVDASEASQASEAVVPTHVEIAFTDRAVLLFEELVRHIKSEETALVSGVDAILSDLVGKVRG